MKEGLHSFKVKILQAPKYSHQREKGTEARVLVLPGGNHNRAEVLGLSLREEQRSFYW